MLGFTRNQYLLRKTNKEIADLKRQLDETEPYANVLMIGQQNLKDSLYQPRVSGATVSDMSDFG